LSALVGCEPNLTLPTRHNNYSVQIRRKISENLHDLASNLAKPTRIQRKTFEKP
jgi:hypothetical protein